MIASERSGWESVMFLVSSRVYGMWGSRNMGKLSNFAESLSEVKYVGIRVKSSCVDFASSNGGYHLCV